MKIKLKTLAAGTALLLLGSVSSVALADGLPFEKPKAQPILTPLDGAANSTTQAPVTTAPVAIEQAPVALKTDIPPVPESRLVEVQPDASFFGLSVGMYDLTHGNNATAFNLEWQPGVRIAGVLQPIFGAMVTTGGTLLGYGGIGVPLKITERFKLMPSISVGAYKEGAGFDLGQTLVYRAGAELAYQFDDKSRIGLNFHALTNGVTLNRNDRTEVVGIGYTTPLSFADSFKPFSPQTAPPPK